MIFLSKIRKLISLSNIFLVICSVGCIIQINHVLSRYFAFEFSTRVVIEVPDKTLLPDIVICSNLAYTINLTKLFTTYPYMKRDLNYSSSESYKRQLKNTVGVSDYFQSYISRKLPINQITKMLYSTDELLIEIRVLDVSSLTNPGLCEIKQFFRNWEHCFIIACSVFKPVYSHAKGIDRLPGSVEFLEIRLNQSTLYLLSDIRVTLIEPNTYPHNRKLKWSTIPIESTPHLYLLHFYIFDASYLPPPYPSKCVNYSQRGFFDKADAFDNCLNQLSLTKLSVPFHASIFYANYSGHFSFPDLKNNQNNKSYMGIISNIVNTCEANIVNVDCRSRLFISKPKSPAALSTPYSTLVLDQIKQPNIKIVHLPRLLFLDCLIMTGSILGFWFGFAVSVHVPKILRSLWMLHFDLHKVSLLTKRESMAKRSINANQLNQVKLFKTLHLY